MTTMRWHGGGMGLFGCLVMVVFLLIVFGLVVWLVMRFLPGSADSRSSAHGPARSVGESPLEMLDRRLASGEIDLETWQAHRAALLAAQRDGS